jgi:hypothetical protein
MRGVTICSHTIVFQPNLVVRAKRKSARTLASVSETHPRCAACSCSSFLPISFFTASSLFRSSSSYALFRASSCARTPSSLPHQSERKQQ